MVECVCVYVCFIFFSGLTHAGNTGRGLGLGSEVGRAVPDSAGAIVHGSVVTDSSEVHQ